MGWEQAWEITHRTCLCGHWRITPRTFIFGGKAAHGYFMAKLISSVGDVMNRDPQANG